jgi:Asp-tRNA(Asn)/Glu-tRNA(Gln) amidotransferase A subunit family amidase
MKMPNVPLKLDLLHATIKDLQQALNTGEYTSVDLIEAYLMSRQIVHDQYTIAVATTRSPKALACDGLTTIPFFRRIHRLLSRTTTTPA